MPDPTQPWDISWQAFGILYGLGLALLWALMWWASRPHDWAALPAPLPELGLEQLAYLHGGPIRTAEAVLAKLLEDKILRVIPRVWKSEADMAASRFEPNLRTYRQPLPPVTGLHGVAAKAVAAPTRHEEVLMLLKKSPEMTSIVDGLRDLGLIGAGKVRVLLCRWGLMILMILWVELGVGWLINARSDLAAWAAMPAAEKAMVITMLLGMAVGLWTVRWMIPNNEYASLTPAGLTLVRALRRGRSHPADNLVSHVAEHYERELCGPAGVVALEGIEHHPDRQVRLALYTPPSYDRGGHGGS